MRELLKVITTTLVLFVAMNLIGHFILQTGLRRYYCLYPADVLVIGHSMSEMGIDRDLLEMHLERSVAKYCMNGAGTGDRLIMLKHYIETTGHKPRYVFYDVSARSFSAGLAENSYALFYPFFSSPSIMEYLRCNASKGDYWTKRLIPLTRYDDTRVGAVIRGYRHDWKCSSHRRVDVCAVADRIRQGQFWQIGFDEKNVAIFEETLSWLNEHDITCFLVALPCMDLLNDAQPELYAKAMNHIKMLSQKYSNTFLYDMNGDLSKRYDLFRDPIHLNREGQVLITLQMAKELRDKLK